MLEVEERCRILTRPDNGENWITNRILLCGPCNRRKSNSPTLSGLMKHSIKSEWKQDRHRANADSAWQRAHA